MVRLKASRPVSFTLVHRIAQTWPANSDSAQALSERQASPLNHDEDPGRPPTAASAALSWIGICLVIVDLPYRLERQPVLATSQYPKTVLSSFFKCYSYCC